MFKYVLVSALVRLHTVWLSVDDVAMHVLKGGREECRLHHRLAGYLFTLEAERWVGF